MCVHSAMHAHMDNKTAELLEHKKTCQLKSLLYISVRPTSSSYIYVHEVEEAFYSTVVAVVSSLLRYINVTQA